MKTPFKKNGSINSAVVYDGPSAIDGAPIFAVATVASSNRKTGGMVQVWIMRRDIDPITANRTGADYSICGNCPLRGRANNKPSGYATGRGCYVNLIQAPNAVYKTFSRGGYPVLEPGQLKQYGRGQKIRAGAYGDPMAIPAEVWRELLAEAETFTGYTHQLNETFTPADSRRTFTRFCMASADTLQQARAFWAEGFRTFRTITSPDDIAPGEILCPATYEAGQKTTCAACGLCKGSGIKAKNIAAVVHGSQKKNAAVALRSRMMADAIGEALAEGVL
jgi:hypothetical protein